MFSRLLRRLCCVCTMCLWMCCGFAQNFDHDFSQNVYLGLLQLNKKTIQLITFWSASWSWSYLTHFPFCLYKSKSLPITNTVIGCLVACAQVHTHTRYVVWHGMTSSECALFVNLNLNNVISCPRLMWVDDVVRDRDEGYAEFTIKSQGIGGVHGQPGQQGSKQDRTHVPSSLWRQNGNGWASRNSVL